MSSNILRVENHGMDEAASPEGSSRSDYMYDEQ